MIQAHAYMFEQTLPLDEWSQKQPIPALLNDTAGRLGWEEGDFDSEEEQEGKIQK